MQAANFDSILERILKETGKDKEEILDKIDRKQKKMAGLLSREGAAFMVAKDYGIDLDTTSTRVKINELKEGLQNIDVLVRVKQVYTPKKFEKNGKKGMLCNMLVEDETGECRAAAWHNHVKEIEDVRKNQILLLKNCYISVFNEKPSLNIGFSSQIDKKVNETILLSESNNLIKLNELKEGLQNVDIIARIITVFPINYFEKEGVKRGVINFLIGDGTKTIRATAWNDMVEIVSELKSGDLIKIEGAYTKQGLKDIELHLGYLSRILKNPKIEETIPGVEELGGIKAAEEKKISEITDADSRIKITGTILSVNRGRLVYDSCPQCNKKVNKETSECDECKMKGIPTAIISLTVDDGTGSIDTTFFKDGAEKIIGKDADKISDELGTKSIEDVIEEISNKLVGKKIEIEGKVKRNAFEDKLGIGVRSFSLEK
ncbi:MAG: hypothetical protein COT15_00690 [Candidatus Diapherotrites archaeon CG08_land_8_20_14_0_20_34_12]|nr:MAG: hypothetical protein COT15_00690 [Candidatus Diapherotrites archaeon CG08_land_8_20_14_0_20_34_12]